MEYRKIINLLNSAPNPPLKFSANNWIELNDESRGKYSTNSQLKYKTSKLNSRLCDHSNAHILLIETITITGAGADYNAKQLD